jgi:hypothetical protein
VTLSTIVGGALDPASNRSDAAVAEHGVDISHGSLSAWTTTVAAFLEELRVSASRETQETTRAVRAGGHDTNISCHGGSRIIEPAGRSRSSEGVGLCGSGTCLTLFAELPRRGTSSFMGRAFHCCASRG